MGRHELEHQLKMLQQIVANLGAEADEAQAAAAVAAHLRRFWAPSMRRQLIDAKARGGLLLSPVARAAIDLLEPPGTD